MNFRKWWVLGRRLEHFSLFPVHRHKDIRCNVLTTIHGLSYTSRISVAVRMALVSHRTGTRKHAHGRIYRCTVCRGVRSRRTLSPDGGGVLRENIPG